MAKRAACAAIWMGWALVVVGLAPAAEASDTRRWIITVDNGTVAGEQTLTCDADGTCRGRFIFKDNGRGPELDEVFRPAADGSLASYRATGATTFGSKVDERFDVEGGKATWASSTEQGASDAPGGRLYVPFNQSVAIADLMFQAAARRGNTLDLLPSGRMTQREVARTTVGQGTMRREVALVAQSGLGLTPSFGWVTTGESPTLFGFIVPGYLAALPEGTSRKKSASASCSRPRRPTSLRGSASASPRPCPACRSSSMRVFSTAKPAPLARP